MIGSRAASGSVATRFRNVVIACSASSRSASMFTSSRFAPPRTCSSATSTAPWKSSASISRRKRAEPVTFVRSPTTTKPVSGSMTNGSSPEKRGRRAALRQAARRQALDGARDLARVLGRRSAAAADEVHEAVLRERAQEAARVARAARRGGRARSAGRRSGGTRCTSARRWARPSMNGRISVAPSEQLTPTRSGSACSTEIQNASTVCPERFRPERSIAVNEIQSGSSGATSLRGDERRLRVQRVEDRLDHEQVDPAVAERRDLLGVRIAYLVERDRAVRGVLDARGERRARR